MIQPYLNITESGIIVGGNDDIDRLDRPREGLVKIFFCDLQFEESAVNFVDNADWLDSFCQSLSKDSFGLYANTVDAINNDKSTIGNTKRGGYF